MEKLSGLHFLMITAKMKVIDKKSHVNEFLTPKWNGSVKIVGNERTSSVVNNFLLQKSPHKMSFEQLIIP